MPISKRGDAWQVTVCHAGQVHRRSSRHWSKAQAREVEQKLLNDLIAIDLGKQPDRTFNDAVAEWLKQEAPRKKSEAKLRSVLSTIAPILEGRSLQDVNDVVREIRAQAGAKGQALAPATLNRRLAFVRRLLSLAYKRWGWLDQPLHQRIELLPERNERHVYLTEAQVERLASLCPRAGDAIRLAAYTGVRRGHLLRLTAADVIGDCLSLGIDSKTGAPQLIPIHPKVQAIAASLPLYVTNQVLRTEFEAARLQMGLAIRFHDLRHTFASWLLQSGADVMHVRDFLGHSSVAVTQRYAHLKTSHLRDALGRIGTETAQSLHKTRKKKAAAAAQ